MSRHEIINPESLGAPRGYSNGILAAPGRMLFVAGQIAWDGEQKLVSDDFATQFGQALSNVIAVVRAAGGTVEDLCRLTVYVTDKHAYLASLRDLGRIWREQVGPHYPTMALVQVADLLEDGAMVEIQATAATPKDGSVGPSSPLIDSVLVENQCLHLTVLDDERDLRVHDLEEELRL